MGGFGSNISTKNIAKGTRASVLGGFDIIYVKTIKNVDTNINTNNHQQSSTAASPLIPISKSTNWLSHVDS